MQRVLEKIIILCLKSEKDYHGFGQVFGSPELDRICQDIGRKLLHEVDHGTEYAEKGHFDIVIVATEIYNSGGHSAVLLDLTRAYRDKKILVVVTDTFYIANHTEAVGLFVSAPNVTVAVAAKQYSAVERIKWLLCTLLSCRAEKVFFLHHMSDAVAAACMLPEVADKIIFYHHSDHRLALGAYTKHCVHADFREPGLINCRATLGIENSTLLPLVCDDDLVGGSEFEFKSRNALTTCTSGSEKFAGEYRFDFFEDVLPDMLATTQGYHYHIGRLPESVLCGIRSSLLERNIAQNRFCHVEWVPSLRQALIDLHVDLYLDSVPVCGCRSVVEAMAASRPIVVHHNYHSRLFSNEDLVYDGAPSWQLPEELFAILRELDNIDQLQKHSSCSRQQYAEHHAPERLALALSQLDDRSTINCSPNLPFYETDTWSRMLDLGQLATEQTTSDTVASNRSGSRAIDVSNLRLAIEDGPPLGRKEWSHLLFFVSQLGQYTRLDLYRQLSEKIGKEQLSEMLFNLQFGAPPDQSGLPNSSVPSSPIEEAPAGLRSRLVGRLKTLAKSTKKSMVN